MGGWCINSGTLASQPTLSRCLGTLGKETNLVALNEGLFQSAARGIRASNKGKRLAEATLRVMSNQVHFHTLRQSRSADCVMVATLRE